MDSVTIKVQFEKYNDGFGDYYGLYNVESDCTNADQNLLSELSRHIEDNDLLEKEIKAYLFGAMLGESSP